MYISCQINYFFACWMVCFILIALRFGAGVGCSSYTLVHDLLSAFIIWISKVFHSYIIINFDWKSNNWYGGVMVGSLSFILEVGMVTRGTYTFLGTFFNILVFGQINNTLWIWLDNDVTSNSLSYCQDYFFGSSKTTCALLKHILLEST